MSFWVFLIFFFEDLPNGHLPKTNAKWNFTKKLHIQENGLLPNGHLQNRHFPNMVNVHYCKQQDVYKILRLVQAGP